MNLLSKVYIVKGDITKLKVDAICNAANASLLGGGGVDGAIHRSAGKGLLEECKRLNGCKTGEAKITKGYNLPAGHVIHTVGPQCENSEQLASCYTESLNLMKSNELRSIAFPCISTGIYGYPNDKAAHVAFNAVMSWMKENQNIVDEVIFCTFLPIDYQLYENLISDFSKSSSS